MWFEDLYFRQFCRNSRNKGIAAELVREIHSIAGDLGFKEIYLLTYEDTLPNWYERLGWKVIGPDVCHGNSVTVMRLQISK